MLLAFAAEVFGAALAALALAALRRVASAVAPAAR